ncbi:MAG: hypothetical protein Q4C70_03400 [Planctomycetia bacterium]|nr:hypothetical protein [Planctomycetia bacterium]
MKSVSTSVLAHFLTFLVTPFIVAWAMLNFLLVVLAATSVAFFVKELIQTRSLEFLMKDYLYYGLGPGAILSAYVFFRRKAIWAGILGAILILGCVGPDCVAQISDILRDNVVIPTSHIPLDLLFLSAGIGNLLVYLLCAYLKYFRKFPPITEILENSESPETQKSPSFSEKCIGCGSYAVIFFWFLFFYFLGLFACTSLPNKYGSIEKGEWKQLEIEYLMKSESVSDPAATDARETFLIQGEELLELKNRFKTQKRQLQDKKSETDFPITLTFADGTPLGLKFATRDSVLLSIQGESKPFLISLPDERFYEKLHEMCWKNEQKKRNDVKSEEIQF